MVKWQKLALRLSQKMPPFGAPALAAGGHRLHVLDGIRGWASLIVVCFHMSWETFGVVEPAFRNSLTASLVDGGLAVSLFFVLSGEALTAAYFSGRGLKSVTELAIKRYFRLALPVLCASLLVWLICQLDLQFTAKAGIIVHRPDWLGCFLPHKITLWETLRFSFWGVFRDPATTLIVNPFLWTMKAELLGSYGIFVLIYLCHGRKFGWVSVLCLSLFFLFISLSKPRAGLYGCLLAGMCFSYLRVVGHFDRIRSDKHRSSLAALGVVIVMLADGYAATRHIGFEHSRFMAVALVYFISGSKFTEFMEAPVSQFLGKISFPLFLIQFPVLVSFTSFFIIKASQIGIFDYVVFPLCIVSICVALAVATLFEPVEGATRAFCRAVSNYVWPKLPRVIRAQ